MMAVAGIESLSRQRRRWARVRGALGNFRPLHERAGMALAGWVEANFKARGALLADFPTGWPAPAPATLAARRRRGLGSRPLEATGRLRRGFALHVGGEGAVLENRVPYAGLHQSGLGVPRRPIFPGTAQALQIIAPGVVRHVREAIEAE